MKKKSNTHKKKPYCPQKETVKNIPIHKHLYLLIFSAINVYMSLACGTNVESIINNEPGYYPYANTPAIFSVMPQLQRNGYYQFQINYTVTNSEANFIGYNLYISTNSITSESIIQKVGRSLQVYSPNGILPSFFHTPLQISNSIPQEIKTQILPHHRPSPALTPFYSCQRYYFRLTAYLHNQLESLPSAQITSCATSSGQTEASCPSNTSCAL